MSTICINGTPWRGKPLCPVPGGLLAGRLGALVVYRPGEKAPAARYPLPMPRWKRAFSQVRLTERLLHTDVRWAVPLRDHTVLLCADRIFRLDLKTGRTEPEDVPVRGKPLSALVLPREGADEPDAFVGDYHSNPDRQPVRIFRRSGADGMWSQVWAFPAGAVRHIHNLVWDPYRERICILTGDEDRESGIWTADRFFSYVTPLFTGSQAARSCQLLPAEDALYYLTDAPSETNRLFRLSQNDPEPVTEINGSVIYALGWNDGLLFSTTVEPDAHASNPLSYRLTNRIGRGIRDDTVHICFLSREGTVTELETYRHDRLPFRLFQYGAASFCEDGQGGAYFSPCCVKYYDQVIRRVSIE